MFGHQDEPQQPSSDSALDAGLNDLVTASAPTVSVAPSAAPDPTNISLPPSMIAAPAEPSLTAPSAPAMSEPTTETPVNTNTLLDIKQQALQQLSPLVGHLDQSPEEKFRTTMMMIQASDNQDLISAAYAAAQSITDEKIRAQALLDLVNEINYFTQHQAK